MSRTDVDATYQPPATTTTVTTTKSSRNAIPVTQVVSQLASLPRRCTLFRASNITPDFPRAKNEGRLIPLPFRYSSAVWSPKTGSIRTITTDAFEGWVRSDITVSGCVSVTLDTDASLGAPLAAMVANQQSQSQQKALLKVKDQDVNLLEVYGERHETLGMIASNADRIKNALSSLKKGNFAGAADALGVKARKSGFDSQWRKNQSSAISNGWLELVYGWRPLLMDTYGGVEALRKGFNPQSARMMRASASNKFNDSKTVTEPISAGTLTTTTSYEIDTKTCIYYRQQSGALSTLSALGITNPAYLAWELTKYSFVVDWFVHIGDFLSSLDAGFGYQFWAGSLTTGIRSRQSKMWIQNGIVSPNTRRIADYFEVHEKFSLVREGLSTFPILSLPAFKDPRSLEHALNSIALLHQSFKR